MPLTSEHKDSVTSVAFNVDGRYVASGSMDGSIIVAETATGQTVTTLEAAEVVVPHPSLTVSGLTGILRETFSSQGLPTAQSGCF